MNDSNNSFEMPFVSDNIQTSELDWFEFPLPKDRIYEYK